MAPARPGRHTRPTSARPGAPTTRERRQHRVRRARTALNALLVTAGLVGAGLAIDGVQRELRPTEAAAPAAASLPSPALDVREPRQDHVQANRELQLSRSDERSPLAAATPRQVPVVARKMWTTERLDLRVQPQQRTRATGTVAAGRQVGLTGVQRAAYVQVVSGRTVRWVTAAYLTARKPAPAPGSLGLVDRPCPGTSGVESGLQPGAVRVYRAVCNNFPQITTYGGYDAHGEHSTGKAIDIMTSDVALGTRIASFLQAHAAQLGLYDIIWRQHIWTPVRASEGWRPMANRGDATANHFDHVHVSVN